MDDREALTVIIGGVAKSIKVTLSNQFQQEKQFKREQFPLVVELLKTAPELHAGALVVSLAVQANGNV